MDYAALGLLAVLTGLGALLLGRRVATEGRARAASRAAWFDACAPLFSEVSRGLSPDGFARLNGRRGGRLFDLQAVPDTLTFRKLPALWLLVSLPEPMPVDATFDLMMRPTGAEPFSNFRTLGHSVLPPAGFPAGAALRTDDPARLPDPGVIAPHLALFAAPGMKELVISPRGLRLVWLAEEAERTGYLLFRNAEMGRTPLAPETLAPLLDALLTLAADLAARAPARHPRAS